MQSSTSSVLEGLKFMMNFIAQRVITAATQTVPSVL
jgi:hypothetical protein